MLKENRLIEKRVRKRGERRRRLICADKDAKTNEHKQPLMQMCVLMLMEEGVVLMYTLCHCHVIMCVKVFNDDVAVMINLSGITVMNSKDSSP